MSDLDLDALAALEQAATPSQWQALASEVIDDEGHLAWTAASPNPVADAALIAAARNALPDLITAARERDGLVVDLHDMRVKAARAAIDLAAAQSDDSETYCGAEMGETPEGECECPRCIASEVAALRERVEAVLDTPHVVYVASMHPDSVCNDHVACTCGWICREKGWHDGDEDAGHPDHSLALLVRAALAAGGVVADPIPSPCACPLEQPTQSMVARGFKPWTNHAPSCPARGGDR